MSDSEKVLYEKYRVLSTKELGRLGENAFEEDCINNGCRFSRACLEAYPYDYILDTGKKLYKIQVKTTLQYDGNKMRFSTNKTSLVHGSWKTTAYTDNDIDYFYLYCPITNDRLLIKKYSRNIVIRKSPSINGQCKSINFAANYTFDTVISGL